MREDDPLLIEAAPETETVERRLEEPETQWIRQGHRERACAQSATRAIRSALTDNIELGGRVS